MSEGHIPNLRYFLTEVNGGKQRGLVSVPRVSQPVSALIQAATNYNFGRCQHLMDIFVNSVGHLFAEGDLKRGPAFDGRGVSKETPLYKEISPIHNVQSTCTRPQWKWCQTQSLVADFTSTRGLGGTWEQGNAQKDVDVQFHVLPRRHFFFLVVIREPRHVCLSLHNVCR